MKLYNTLTRSLETFEPVNPPHVGLYTCGITAYDYAHIGNGKKYVGDDILRRTLIRAGFTVTHVQNVTDVGHLASDADEGEDKLEKGARRTGKTVWEVAEYYTNYFYDQMRALGNLEPTIICKATDHISEQISLVQELITRGFAYDTPEAVYFDVTSFPTYATLFGQSLADKKIAVREEVNTGNHKRNPIDFSLWFKRTGRFADHAMHWPSPWGEGFPGWHIECSAMSLRYLGNAFADHHFTPEATHTIDLHTGGIDHIPVHHPNEIAQSEAATGKQFVKYWLHHAFLLVDGKKMSKSLNNFIRLSDIQEKGFDSLSLRYLYLTAHYRTPMNFTWESLTAADRARRDLQQAYTRLQTQKNNQEREALSEEKLAKVHTFTERFDNALYNDLNTAQALAVVWEMVKSNIPASDKADLLHDFNSVLGVLHNQPTHQTLNVPDEILQLAKQRDELRADKKYAEADKLRNEIAQKGFTIVDTDEGSKIEPNS